MKVLIDTCVVIDVLQDREPFSADAKKLFLAVANEKCEGMLTAKTTTDIYYLMHRHTHSDKESRRVLNALFTLFELLDTTGLDCKKALSSETSDYEDAVMIESAIHAEVDCIVTRNLKDFEKSPISVYSPSDFLELLRKKEIGESKE